MARGTLKRFPEVCHEYYIFSCLAHTTKGRMTSLIHDELLPFSAPVMRECRNAVTLGAGGWDNGRREKGKEGKGKGRRGEGKQWPSALKMS